ncbi:MAG: hypothetical protein R3192_12945 [Woeseiaceae bacterium]|nr:hypothetical protein [Woeseiaceae bacterium]
MSLAIALILAAALIVLLVMSKKSKSPSPTRPKVLTESQTTTSKFHAVSVQYAAGACDAARSIEGKRFLSSAAPRLPLPDCDARECKCRFMHHADRRSGVDRRGRIPANMIASARSYDGKERRYRERRAGDEPQNFFA